MECSGYRRQRGFCTAVEHGGNPMMRLISLVFVLASTAMALPGGLHAQILGQEGAAHQSRVHAPTGVSRTFGTVDEAVVTTAFAKTPAANSVPAFNSRPARS